MSDQNKANLEKIDMVFITKSNVQKGCGKSERWVTSEFWVDEYIGRPYFGAVDISAKGKDLDFSKMLGKSCIFEVSRGAKRVRQFKGIVYKVEILGTHLNQSSAKAHFAPALFALDHGQNSRIFQDKTAPQVIEQVLKEGLAPFERKVKMQVSGKYANREYCVQYKESDLNFIQRLMIDEGLTCYFDQSTEYETLVIVDCNEAHIEVDTMGDKLKPVEEVQQQALDDCFTAGQCASGASNCVEIELTDEKGNPIPKAEYSLKLPNGKIMDYQLRDNGWDNVPISKHPKCEICFKNQMDWRPKDQEGSAAKNEAGEEATEHIVKQGDCLSSIAYKHGLPWQKLWGHPKNKDLKDLRKNPNILFPGDRVFIPERQIRWEKCSIKAKNSFIAKLPKKTFKFALLDDEKKPIEDATYKLVVNKEEFVGATKSDGMIVAQVDAGAISGTLSTNDGPEESIGIGHLNPVQNVNDQGVTGIQARLSSLCYGPGPVDGIIGPRTRAAIRTFQQEHGMESTGEISEELTKKLEETYGY